MRALFLTANALRHKYLVNELSNEFDETLVVSECKNSVPEPDYDGDDLVKQHFAQRDKAELLYFGTSHTFCGNVIPIPYQQVNTNYILNQIQIFSPDVVVVSGSSIIKTPLLSLLKNVPTFNLHLGLVPYYKGSGTNFWPFINNELDKVGGSILRLEKGVDLGSVCAQFKPVFVEGDDAHSIGCKVIMEGTKVLKSLILSLKKGKTPRYEQQLSSEKSRTYRNADFNRNTVIEYRKNIENNIVGKFILEGQKNKQGS